MSRADATPPRRPLLHDLDAFDDDEATAGAEASLVAHLVEPSPRKPATATASAAVVSKGIGSSVAVGSIGAAILALDKVLRDHGETLESLTAAGPLAGALLQNWPLLLFGFLLARVVAVRWREWGDKQRARDLLTARDRKQTIRVLKLVATETDRVAVEIGALRSDLATVRDLAAATDSRTREDAAALRRHVDEGLGELRSRIGRIEPRN